MGGSSSWRKGCRLGRRAGGSSRGALGVGWGGEGVFWILDQRGGSRGRRGGGSLRRCCRTQVEMGP